MGHLRKRIQVIVNLPETNGAVVLVVPADYFQHQGDVFRVPGQNADAVKGRCERDKPVP
jgi:hypothetical protein